MTNYPIPDPAWDYARIWEILQESKTDYDQLISYIASLEESTPATDTEIKEKLDVIGQRLNSARRLLDE